MENKKYIDKVVGSLVRGTKIDYENGRVYPSFNIYGFPLILSFFSFSYSPSFFSHYCKNQFGLTKEEINYVWDQYSTIMKNKIRYGEQ